MRKIQSVSVDYVDKEKGFPVTIVYRSDTRRGADNLYKKFIKKARKKGWWPSTRKEHS